MKIFWNASLAWAVDYGGSGYSMVLSPDSSFLIAGSDNGYNDVLGKLNSSNGAVLASYDVAFGGTYAYIYV